jgi:ubiquinone/menaquinone biosynthesis C-methylase UbiE
MPQLAAKRRVCSSPASGRTSSIVRQRNGTSQEDRLATTPLLPYDRHVGRYSPALANALLRVAGVGAGDRVLDVGCGTGALARASAALLGPERVAAVDPSPGAVEACGAAVPGADVRLGAADKLPFADSRFDAVLSQLVIDKVDGPAALREMSRVARPGAVIAASVWDFEAGMPLLRAYWDAALAVDPSGSRAAGADERRPTRLSRS